MMVEVGADRVEAAYRVIHPRLWRALVSFTRDAELASDAESEAFTQALRRGDGIDDVEAWVWRSAFKIAAGMLARREPSGVMPDRRVVDPTPLSEFLSLLDGLSAQQRAIAALRYIGGFTPAEIAAVLDTSPGSVRVQLHRAHAALRTTLEKEQRDG
jgi:RNA polymerase sigma factor (sigma-70 family)